MPNRGKIGGLYLILDQQYTNQDIVSIAIEAAEAGVDVIQYREKVLPKKGALSVAKRLREVTVAAGIMFIVNDDPALALGAEADGVHLGQEDIPVDVARRILGRDKVIGISTHNIEEALDAGQMDVDYIGFGPVFHSVTKMVTSPHGLEGVRRIRDSVSMPVIAIGGIDQGNVSAVIRAGADGVAVISAVLSAPNVKKAVSELKKGIGSGRNSL